MVGGGGGEGGGVFFFFNDTATTEIYTLSLHDALPIWAEKSLPEEEVSAFTTLCDSGIPRETWYHYANATDAVNVTSLFNGTDVLVGDNIPVCANGTYYSIGI